MGILEAALFGVGGAWMLQGVFNMIQERAELNAEFAEQNEEKK